MIDYDSNINNQGKLIEPSTILMSMAIVISIWFWHEKTLVLGPLIWGLGSCFFIIRNSIKGKKCKRCDIDISNSFFCQSCVEDYFFNFPVIYTTSAIFSLFVWYFLLPEIYNILIK